VGQRGQVGDRDPLGEADHSEVARVHAQEGGRVGRDRGFDFCVSASHEARQKCEAVTYRFFRLYHCWDELLF
jgi:hypothetical protein